jgi:hypothetical protein
MKLVHGIHHKRSLEDILISVFQFAIVATILGIVALVAVDAWVDDDNARVANLQKHFYDVAMSTDVSPPKSPTGVKPNYGALAEPKTRVFADTSVKSKERGK